jgi:hypothetical protein
MKFVFYRGNIKMVSASRSEKLSTLQWRGLIREAVIWVMILAVLQILMLPTASPAEMTPPQISDSVGIGLLAGLVVLLIAVGLLSRKAETAPATQEQKPGDSIEPPENTAPSPSPAGTVAIVAW